jgi:hypothetical protein
MEPFRAFVADLVPPEQRTDGFATPVLSFIGLGAMIAPMLARMTDGSTVGHLVGGDNRLLCSHTAGVPDDGRKAGEHRFRRGRHARVTAQTTTIRLDRGSAHPTGHDASRRARHRQGTDGSMD